MEKFKYGPLIWKPFLKIDESVGNYYWNGNPPVGYDAMRVKIPF